MLVFQLAQIREEFKEKEAAFASCNEQHVQKIAELTDTKNSDIDKLKNEIEMLKQQLQEATNEMKMSSDMKNDAMVYMGQLTEQVDSKHFSHLQKLFYKTCMGQPWCIKDICSTYFANKD